MVSKYLTYLYLFLTLTGWLLILIAKKLVEEQDLDHPLHDVPEISGIKEFDPGEVKV